MVAISGRKFWHFASHFKTDFIISFLVSTNLITSDQWIASPAWSQKWWQLKLQVFQHINQSRCCYHCIFLHSSSKKYIKANYAWISNEILGSFLPFWVCQALQFCWCTCKSETCKFYAAVIVCGLLKLTEYFLDFFEYYISTTSKIIKKEFTQG